MHPFYFASHARPLIRVFHRSIYLGARAVDENRTRAITLATSCDTISPLPLVEQTGLEPAYTRITTLLLDHFGSARRV